MLLMSAFMAPTTQRKIDRNIRVRKHVSAGKYVGACLYLLRIREVNLSTALESVEVAIRVTTKSCLLAQRKNLDIMRAVDDISGAVQSNPNCQLGNSSA